MFRHLNKIIRRNPLRKMAENRSGQVAVILILVVAAALIFYAVSLNLGRVSQTKIITTMAADTGAALLGSYMASYGQRLFQEVLGGHRRVCGLTGVLVTIIVIVVSIITIVLMLIPGAQPIGMAFYVAVMSAVLATGALILQLTVIQPTMMSMWNEQIWSTMDQVDATVESGIQTALSMAATDTVSIPDLHDADGDRVWGMDGNGQPLDELGRFSIYYQKNRIGAIPRPLVTEIEAFLEALKDFLSDTGGGDDWGIYDNTGPNCSPFSVSSECNPCCVPVGARNPEFDCDNNPDTLHPKSPLRRPGTPEFSFPVENEDWIKGECAKNSPYGDGTANSNYPWVYDPYRGNPANDADPDPANVFISFQEHLGRDDEHRGFEKRPAGPNGFQDPAAAPPMPANIFQLQDNTGFYAVDNRRGIFPFFYKIADWKMSLDTATDPFDLVNKPHQCHWCDPRYAPVGACPDNSSAPARMPQPAEIPQLALPADALNPNGVNTPGGAEFNTTYCVDGTGLSAGSSRPPLAADLVRLPDPADQIFWRAPSSGNVGRIEASPDQCAQKADNTTAGRQIGFWKRGGDRFCSAGGDEWPYYEKCPKYGYNAGSFACSQPDGDGGTMDAQCACGVAGSMPPQDTNNGWPDDLVDEILYGLNLFADWGRELAGNDAQTLEKAFKNWYVEAAEWIEGGNLPPSQGGSNAVKNPLCASCCYYCLDENGQSTRDGLLWGWYKQIKEMNSRLRAWRDASFAGADCNNVWCVPPEGCPGGGNAPGGLGPESDTFDANGNRIRGDFEDVVACLDWNINDVATASDGTEARGNAQKFQACEAACQVLEGDPSSGPLILRATELCSNLPRSLVSSSLVFQAPASGALNSCDPNQPFRPFVRRSAVEATNQVIKFTQRYNFLSSRLTELNRAIAVMDRAENEFYNFLTCDDNDGDNAPDGVACRLIKARINLDNRESGLPYHVVYGWRSPAPVGRPEDQGRWHIVRVDGRVPGKCDGDCNVNQTDGVDGDPRWPWVRSGRENGGTRLCYELRSTSGIVKMRVSRYDESGNFSSLNFPNAVEIWKPSFGRSDRPETSSGNPDNIETECAQNMLPEAPGAFLLNGRYLDRPDPDCLELCAGNPDCESQCPALARLGTIACWDMAQRLLAQGVTSETCAEYYYHGANPKGMDFKFIPCPRF